MTTEYLKGSEVIKTLLPFLQTTFGHVSPKLGFQIFINGVSLIRIHTTSIGVAYLDVRNLGSNVTERHRIMPDEPCKLTVNVYELVCTINPITDILKYKQEKANG